MKVKSDHRSKFSNLSNWKEEAWKNQGFNGIRTRDLRDTGAMLYQLSCEATHRERGQFNEFISLETAVQIWIISYKLQTSLNEGHVGSPGLTCSEYAAPLWSLLQKNIELTLKKGFQVLMLFSNVYGLLMRRKTENAWLNQLWVKEVLCLFGCYIGRVRVV